MDSNNKTNLFDNRMVEITLPRSIRFWLLLLMDMPSLICSIFVLYHILTKKELRSALYNHVIIALLMCVMTSQLLDIPIYLTFIRLNQVWPKNRSMCLFWWYVDVGFCNTCGIILAWASIERHILVFHDKLLSTRKKRIFLHYVLLLCVIVYASGFYLLSLFIPSCDHSSIDYGLPWCHYSPCYYSIKWLHHWDIIVNRLLPCLLIAIFSIALLWRVLWQKHHRLQRPIVWRNHRKMTIQLVSVSAVYLIFGFPLFIVQICQLSHVQLNPQIQLWLYFLSFSTILSVPFVCLVSLPTKVTEKPWKVLIHLVPKRQLGEQ